MKVKIIIPVILGLWFSVSVSYAAVTDQKVAKKNRGNSMRTGTGSGGVNLEIIPVVEQPLSGFVKFTVTVTGFGQFGTVSLSETAGVVGDPRAKFRLIIHSPESNTGACFYEHVSATVDTSTATGINIEPGAVPHQFDDLPWKTTLIFRIENGTDVCDCYLWYPQRDDTGN